MVSHVCVDNRQDLFGGVPSLKVIPNTNRKLRGINAESSRPLMDFRIIGEIKGPHLGSVLAIENERVVYLPCKEILGDKGLDKI